MILLHRGHFKAVGLVVWWETVERRVFGLQGFGRGSVWLAMRQLAYKDNGRAH